MTLLDAVYVGCFSRGVTYVTRVDMANLHKFDEHLKEDFLASVCCICCTSRQMAHQLAADIAGQVPQGRAMLDDYE